jgi:predicted transcriptional regulator
MLVIHHHGRPAAYVTAEAASLAGNIAALEADHPVRRWVVCMCFFAQDVLEGQLLGPYTPVRAEYFARCALLPEEEFASAADRTDATLAEVFNVPLEQVRERRSDLVGQTRTPIRAVLRRVSRERVAPLSDRPGEASF